jgi:hypothetical protein
MLTRLKKLLAPGRSPTVFPHGASGYVYATAKDRTSLREAPVGAVVRNPDDGPPWIVVDHALESVNVARWPGRLLKVEILDIAKEQPRAYANYTRATAISVVAELSAIDLLGEHGVRIAQVIERIETLSIDEAMSLSASSDPSASLLYDAAWKAWLRAIGAPAFNDEEDHRHTLIAGGSARRSPVGYALTLIYSHLQARAELLSGSAATGVNDEGESTLMAPWDGAADALLHAAMAFGAPGLFTREQVATMTLPWRKLMLP